MESLNTITIKVGNRDIPVNIININAGERLINIFCNEDSYNIFESWFNIVLAYMKSREFNKRNICKDIVIDKDKYCNCFIKDEDKKIHKVIISYDYSTFSEPAVISSEEAINRMKSLFN